MITKKNEIYYYITKKVIIKLKALRDDYGDGGMTLGFKILDYVRGNPDDAGHGYALQKGESILSNQLNYVSTHGVSSVITKYGPESIRGVFENEIL